MTCVSKVSKPLPLRDGIDPIRVRVKPAAGTLYEQLSFRFVHNLAELDEMFAQGLVVDQRSRPLAPQTRPHANYEVWTYQLPAPEQEVPQSLQIIHEDDRLLVVDKPHFLATTPRSSRVWQTALVKLRQLTGYTDISPIHRLDRITAGVLVFSKRTQDRQHYQQLFDHRQVHKTYRAVLYRSAQHPHPHNWDNEPTIRRSTHIEKTRGILQAREIAAPANAHTIITDLGPVHNMVPILPPDLATHTENRREPTTPQEPTPMRRVHLEPTTGKTHQLRLHTSALGWPILHDPLYPHIWPAERDRNFSTVVKYPLQLLAYTLSFTDPIDGKHHQFTSGQHLATW